MTTCDICADGYVGMFGEPPCTACPESSISNDLHTICTQCIGYQPGCTPIGGSGGIGIGDGGSDSNSIGASNLTARVLLLEKKIQAQQSYIERYKKQRNQAEL